MLRIVVTFLLVIAACKGSETVGERIQRRYEADKLMTFGTLGEALNEATVAMRTSPGDLAAATTAARAVLVKYFKPDEAAAFQLWSGDGVMVLYAKTRPSKYMWLARDDKRLLTEPAQLPASARAILER